MFSSSTPVCHVSVTPLPLGLSVRPVISGVESSAFATADALPLTFAVTTFDAGSLPYMTLTPSSSNAGSETLLNSSTLYMQSVSNCLGCPPSRILKPVSSSRSSSDTLYAGTTSVGVSVETLYTRM